MRINLHMAGVAAMLITTLAHAQTPPSNLAANIDPLQGSVELSWLGYNQQAIRYDDNTIETGYINSTSAPSGQVWAIRMSVEEAVQLQKFQTVVFEGLAEGDQIVALNDVAFLVFAEGSDTDTPGALLYSSPTITPEASGWIGYDFSEQELAFSGDFWVGISFVVPGGPFVAFDTTPPLDNRLRVANPPYDTWSSFSQAYDMVGVALVQTDTGLRTLPASGTGNHFTQTSHDLLSCGPLPSVEISSFAPVSQSASSEREFVEYHIYRDGEQIAQTTNTSYSDQLNLAGEFSYSVTALHSEGESTASNEVSVSWHANITPPLNFMADPNLETGEVELSWEMYDWGQQSSTLTDPVSTESFDGNWYWQEATFTQKFYPTGTSRLLGARFRFTGGTPFGVRVFDIGQYGWPNNILAEVDADAHLPGWTYVDLQSEELVFDSPFAIGFYDQNGGSAILYNNSTGSNSYLLNPSGNWGNFDGGGLCLHIEALVEYADGRRDLVRDTRDLQSFEILRDGSSLATVGGDTREYTDALPVQGSYTYQMRSVFDEGTSGWTAEANAIWQDNLCANGDFEHWNGTEPADWTLDLGDSAIAEQETETVHHGDSAVRVTWTSSGTKKLKQQTLVVVGETYTFRAWVYDNDPQGNVHLRMFFRDEEGQGAAGEQEGVDRFTSQTTGDEDAWTYLEVSGPAPENTYDVRVYLRFTGTDEFTTQATAVVDNCTLFGPSVEIPSATIDEIQLSIAEGSQVLTGGVVTVPSGAFSDDDYIAYLQDDSGYGVQLYDSDHDFSTVLNRGDTVSVIGTVEEVDGITRLSNISLQVLSSGNELPTPDVIQPGEANSSYEGRWTQMTGNRGPVQSDPFGQYIPVSNDSGQWTMVRLFSASDLSLDGTAEGDEITFDGVVTVVAGVAQLAPALPEDIRPNTAIDNPHAAPASYELMAAYPNPFNPVTQLDVVLPVRADARLSVSNLRGEEVALLHQGLLSAGTHSFAFDGSAFASGWYLARFSVNGRVAGQQKLLLVK